MLLNSITYKLTNQFLRGLVYDAHWFNRSVKYIIIVEAKMQKSEAKKKRKEIHYEKMIISEEFE